jgi:hypothetical protein
VEVTSSVTADGPAADVLGEALSVSEPQAVRVMASDAAQAAMATEEDTRWFTGDTLQPRLKSDAVTPDVDELATVSHGAPRRGPSHVARAAGCHTVHECTMPSSHDH